MGAKFLEDGALYKCSSTFISWPFKATLFRRSVASGIIQGCGNMVGEVGGISCNVTANYLRVLFYDNKGDI